MLRANTVHFFDISTSKNGPNLVCFVHFDLETCFASQRRTLFRLRNFQKRSEADFFISHLARWLRTHRFTNHWENTVIPGFSTFSRACIFFLLTLSLLRSSLFYSSLLSDSSHLCFSSVHIVGSFTSKLPSVRLNFHHSPSISATTAPFSTEKQ